MTKIIKGFQIDPRIFTFHFNCKCQGECCHYGVGIDQKEYDIILSIKDSIISRMDETQPKNIDDWFDEPEYDDDSKSSVTIDTKVANNKCVFLDGKGLCAMQKLAVARNEFKWKYKPLYCVLFPLTIYENTITVDDEHIDRLKSCNFNKHKQTSVFEFCQEELKYLLGEDGFNELNRYQEEYLQTLKEMETV
jgi:hypothetical protein